MTMDKAIQHGHERRRPYRKHQRHCRGHARCPTCKGNRTHGNKRREPQP